MKNFTILFVVEIVVSRFRTVSVKNVVCVHFSRAKMQKIFSGLKNMKNYFGMEITILRK